MAMIVSPHSQMPLYLVSVTFCHPATRQTHTPRNITKILRAPKRIGFYLLVESRRPAILRIVQTRYARRTTRFQSSRCFIRSGHQVNKVSKNSRYFASRCPIRICPSDYCHSREFHNVTIMPKIASVEGAMRYCRDLVDLSIEGFVYAR